MTPPSLRVKILSERRLVARQVFFISLPGFSVALQYRDRLRYTALQDSRLFKP